ncbi:MAG: invasion protein, partial [Epsilonproteobacteria bacterium 4484_65]
MQKQQFMKDLQVIYDELQIRQANLNRYYELLDEKKGHDRANKVVDAFLSLIDIPRNKESEMAVLTRIVNLREDALEQVLEKHGCSKEEIVMKKELAYGFASTMHITRHENFITWVEEKKLLTPFYRSLILGVHYVGVKILDEDESGCVGDRCYSVLKKEDTGYKSIAYAQAFPDEVEGVVTALEQLISLLNQHEDEVFDQKSEWIAYFTAIKEAFSHTQTSELIGK